MPRGKSAWPPPPDQEVFTTGEVAKACNVTIRTVIRWIDTGQLDGYKIPGSRDRRVPRPNLIKFMEAHGLPLGVLDPNAGRKRVLIVDDDEAILELLEPFVRTLGDVEVATASNGYEAGTKTISLKPDVLLIDYNLGDITGLDVARTARTHEELKEMRIVCMSGFLDESNLEQIRAEGVDDFLKKPLDLARLGERLKAHLGL